MDKVRIDCLRMFLIIKLNFRGKVSLNDEFFFWTLKKRWSFVRAWMRTK